ncbi:hypothetical protein [Pedobacter aquatilis]|uniref:hypothetical protein n=1 Tax=Pedobacter aquatilis TaxID=351343 RepID=UPI00292FE0DD|nr:hypothetical protein [Pedobacter aquatilis]
MKCQILMLFAILALHFQNIQAQCISGDCQNGNGMLKTAGGSIYQGSFKGGLPNGAGRLVTVSGEEYQGGMLNGLFDGEGTYFYNDSTVYKGHYVLGMRQGKGSLEKGGKVIYTGFFRNNLPETVKDKEQILLAMNYYTDEGFNHWDDFGQFNFKDNVVSTAAKSFELSTGMLSNRHRPDSVSYKGLHYEKYGEFYNQLKKDYKDLSARILFRGDGYLIITDAYMPKNNKTKVNAYRIELKDGRREKLSSFEISYYENFKKMVCSRDGKAFFADWVIYTEKGKKGVLLENDASVRYEPSFFDAFCWFSANSDTLYRWIPEKRLDRYSSASGKLLRSDKYVLSRLKDSGIGYSRLIAASDQDLRVLVYFDDYDTSVGMKSGNVSNAFRKAAVLKLDDPDYMLALVDPKILPDAYDETIARVKADKAQWHKEVMELRAKIKTEAASGILSADFYGSDKEDTRKPLRTKSTAGVCIWCKGSGTVTTKDVFDKGYNTTYTIGGARRTQTNGSGSSSTSVCMACHGSGH